jgi:murein DD-endopeptidase MepM/ murein hydrolase activator NlpD
LDEVEDLSSKREEMLASIPAIKPIRSDKIERNISSLSGFGMRMHPIFKRRKMHTGIDFTCPQGTPIHASGDGKIVSIKDLKSGYGTHVIIDHGFGYKSLYGHMSDVDVTLGQKIKRGQVIGKVGSTGTSTAPHLHYEVINKNQKVNPIHYCMDGLSDMEYQQLVNMASISNQSFD